MIIYKDKNVITVNKPAGIVVHPDDWHKSGTLIQKIAEDFPEIKTVGDEPEIRPGVVHRLDKDTSGILLIARNQKAFEFLKRQFQEKTIKKTYVALLKGNLKNDTGVIDIPIGRSRKDPTRRLASEQARGKLREAVTEYKVLKRIDGEEGKFTLVEAYPKTGRTHQLRVHFKALGYPIICDRLYGTGNTCPAGLGRHFLHAVSIEFTLPKSDGTNGTTGKLKLEADLTEDLQKVLQELG